MSEERLWVIKNVRTIPNQERPVTHLRYFYSESGLRSYCKDLMSKGIGFTVDSYLRTGSTEVFGRKVADEQCATNEKGNE